MRKLLLAALYLCFSFLQSGFVFSEESSYRVDEPSETIQKKKSHSWLIPVGAGAGGGIGLLVGLSAFDDAVNSDTKIWTTTAVCAGAGALLGWLFARHLDKPPRTKLSMQPNLVPGPNFICTRQSSELMQQADCLYPDYLKMDL